MFGHGAAYFNNYHQHMYDWLNNPGCDIVGFMLITATLASSIFYMLEVVVIYQKLRWPLHVNRHMTRRRLGFIVLATWTGALIIAAIPFLTSSKAQYNKVGLCLPFYAGEFSYGFKYVILYTTILSVNVTTVIVLTVLLVRSLVKNRRQWYGAMPIKVAERNKMLERMLLIALAVYILINLVLIVFLVMSCVGGKTGKTGREWFSRLCVLEAVTNPLVGPIRKKNFYRDTRRLLRRWGLRQGTEESSTSSTTGYSVHMKVERNESQRRLKAQSVAKVEESVA